MPVQQMNSAQKRVHPVLKKMNAEEEGLSVNQRLDLTISERQVELLMGPEPIPTLDIEFDEIQNELQRKMVEEISCVVCGQFPYKPLECRSCNKLFCKYCQLQLGKGNQADYDYNPQELDNFGNFGNMGKKNASAGRDGRGNSSLSKSPKYRSAVSKTGLTPDYDICCPNCQTRGDFLQPVNQVLQNCLDFCEFPHRCPGKKEVIWKTIPELMAHSQFHCPKFGCDICYRDEFQHMTRAELYDHIKRDCPAVRVMCQICNKEYTREDFGKHQCIKDFYIEKLQTCSYDVIEHLADKLILHRRQNLGLGLCSKQECVEQHRRSGMQGPMIVQNTEYKAFKCYNSKDVLSPYEDSYCCMYCKESYSPPSIGYCKWYELEEMEQLLAKIV